MKDIGLLEGVLRYIIVGMENLEDDVRLKHFGLTRLDRSISDCQWNVQYQKKMFWTFIKVVDEDIKIFSRV